MKQPKNIVASVQDRLKTLSKKQNDDFQILLARFAVERFLFRLSRSQFASRFIVKGASLFFVWLPSLSYHRVTRDIDLLGLGNLDENRLLHIFHEVCELPVEEDGLIFDSSTLKTAPIRPQEKYGGTRVTFLANLGNIRLPMQIDIGFGDGVSPPPVLAEFPTLLNFENPRLEVYRRETMIAEKFHAMVEREVANSRLKDFYDVALLSRTFQFEAETLWAAILKTFELRGTTLPDKMPVAFTDKFLDPSKNTQWKAFVKKKLRQTENDFQLSDVMGETRDFLWPLFERFGQEKPPRGVWEPPGPWSFSSGD